METAEEKKNSPRKKIIAFLLSIVPGLGQLYNGQLKKAFIFFFGLFALAISINLFGLKSHFWTYVIAFTILVILQLLTMIDAVVVAHRQKDYQLKKYNKWYIYLIAIILLLLLNFAGEKIADTTRYRMFRVGSDSGCPNLLRGDYVLSDFCIYDTQNPTYGDLVVYVNSDKESYTFRIVGMPNDTISIENQLVKYKSKEFSSEILSTQMYDKYETEEIIETLPNGLKYRIFRNKTPTFEETANISEIIVPENAYFLMGDNRDFSADSRFFGFAQREQIQGKVLAIFFSMDLARINKSLSE